MAMSIKVAYDFRLYKVKSATVADAKKCLSILPMVY